MTYQLRTVRAVVNILQETHVLYRSPIWLPDYLCGTKDTNEGGDSVKYFVKNLKVHKYPVPKTCPVKYEGEKLHDTPPPGYEKCDRCFTELPK